MESIPDSVMGHLRDVIGRPDLGATKYELFEEIGRGGMGAVYRARDAELNRFVALKILDDDVPPGEAQILASLEHPGIVPVHDLGALPDGRIYYAMKLVNGMRLDNFAASEAPLTERLRLFSRICEPVAFAHARGYIHRDLKPDNIMVGEFGEVLVLDWGIAQRADSAPLRVAGTDGYMAPEQKAGSVLDARADVYALGRILNFLVHGQQTAKPLAAIADKASSPNREDRYATADQLAADVARFLDGHPVLAYRETPIERAIRWIRHHPTLSALIATYITVRAMIFLFTRR